MLDATKYEAMISKLRLTLNAIGFQRTFSADFAEATEVGGLSAPIRSIGCLRREFKFKLRTVVFRHPLHKPIII